jgi:hypothetical protein
MSDGKKLKVLAAALVALLLVNSCADFFSTSWGEAFKRDPRNVNVTPSNVYELLETAKSDPDLSKAILDKIAADPDPSPALKHAAIKAANQAAGVTTLVLENVKILIDAANGGDLEEAIINVAGAVQNAAKNTDFIDISDKLTDILVKEVVIPAENPRGSLINTGHITVSVPKTGGGEATVTIDVGKDGKGTVTIDGVTYECEISDEKDAEGKAIQTITLRGAGANGADVVLDYAIDDEDRSLTLSGLDQIAGAGLAKESNPSSDPVASKPEFEGTFLDDSVPDSDLSLMVISLVLAKYDRICAADPKKFPELEDYLRSWEDKNVATGYGMDDEEILIAATVNGMIDRGDITNDKNKLIEMIEKLLRVNKK